MILGVENELYDKHIDGSIVIGRGRPISALPALDFTAAWSTALRLFSLVGVSRWRFFLISSRQNKGLGRMHILGDFFSRSFWACNQHHMGNGGVSGAWGLGIGGIMIGVFLTSDRVC